jgi:hypothetical protein
MIAATDSDTSRRARSEAAEGSFNADATWFGAPGLPEFSKVMSQANRKMAKVNELMKIQTLTAG